MPLKQAAEETAETLTQAGEEFSKSLMGKAFKPLILALIQYVKVNNQRLAQLEAK